MSTTFSTRALVTMALAATCGIQACSGGAGARDGAVGPTPDATAAGGGTGGSAGGAGGTAGSSESGGRTGSGGSAVSGGATGVAGSGGAAGDMGGTGGTVGTGGIAGTVGTGGIAGTVGTGGIAGTGGRTGTGGVAGTGGAAGASGPINPSANVKVTKLVQVIDGFGVSNAWLTPPAAGAKTAVYDALFSVSKGAGLSILRNRVPFRENPSNDDKFINKNTDGTYRSTANADGSKTFSLNWGGWDLTNTASVISDIKAKGADYQVSKFMSTPWTPPNNSISKWKISDSYGSVNYASTPEVGGSLDPARYSDYADLLADYVLGFKAKMGVDLTVLSLQNEPNFKCTYESANWTADQFHTFMATLKTEFTKKGVLAQLPNLKIMAAEYQNVKEDLILPILGDSNTASVLGVVGVHQYEFGTRNVGTYAAPALTTSLNAGKPVWMTEFSTAAWAANTSMTDALIVARLIHMDMTAANMSAFLYWWSWGSGNGVLVEVNGSNVTVPKRLYALGQWSRFVRPNWVRVETTASPASNLYLSAFKDPAGNQVAVVAVNTGTAQATLPLSLDQGQFGTLNAYRTSSSENIAAVGTVASGATATVTLPASSVTTFVGAITP